MASFRRFLFDSAICLFHFAVSGEMLAKSPRCLQCAVFRRDLRDFSAKSVSLILATDSKAAALWKKSTEQGFRGLRGLGHRV